MNLSFSVPLFFVPEEIWTPCVWTYGRVLIFGCISRSPALPWFSALSSVSVSLGLILYDGIVVDLVRTYGYIQPVMLLQRLDKLDFLRALIGRCSWSFGFLHIIVVFGYKHTCFHSIHEVLILLVYELSNLFSIPHASGSASPDLLRDLLQSWCHASHLTNWRNDDLVANKDANEGAISLARAVYVRDAEGDLKPIIVDLQHHGICSRPLKCLLRQRCLLT